MWKEEGPLVLPSFPQLPVPVLLLSPSSLFASSAITVKAGPVCGLVKLCIICFTHLLSVPGTQEGLCSMILFCQKEYSVGTLWLSSQIPRFPTLTLHLGISLPGASPLSAPVRQTPGRRAWEPSLLHPAVAGISNCSPC